MRLIIGISGASGAIMGVELLRELSRKWRVETHLVMTDSALLTLKSETSLNPDSVYALASAVYDNHNMGAKIASGSFAADGMIIMPCSMKTTAGIVSGYSDNLLLRAADVCLKEQRKLVIVPRESPLSVIHLRNLKKAAKAGCVVMPPVLTFYDNANTVEKQIRNIVGRTLLQFGFEVDGRAEWQGL